jgi:hypothetical protein
MPGRQLRAQPKNRGQFGPPDTSRDTEVAKLHAQGMGRNDIHRLTGSPGGTVTNIAKRLGLKFDATQALEATEINRRRAAERRATLINELLDDAELLRERLLQPMTYVQYGGKDFDRKEDTYDLPTAQDQANLARAITLLIGQSVRLEEVGQQTAGLDGAINFLDGVTLTIRGTVPELESGE